MKVKNEHKLKNKNGLGFTPNAFLEFWLVIHMIAIVIAIPILAFLPFGLAAPILGLYLVDACIQLWCVRKLWKGKSSGLYGLMILFVLRVASLVFMFSGGTDLIFGIVFGNGLDAFLLWAGVTASKSMTHQPTATNAYGWL